MRSTINTQGCLVRKPANPGRKVILSLISLVQKRLVCQNFRDFNLVAKLISTKYKQWNSANWRKTQLLLTKSYLIVFWTARLRVVTVKAIYTRTFTDYSIWIITLRARFLFWLVLSTWNAAKENVQSNKINE